MLAFSIPLIPGNLFNNNTTSSTFKNIMREVRKTHKLLKLMKISKSVILS